VSERTQTDEIVIYWRQIIGTLHQRGLLKRRSKQGGAILPEADAYLLPDRCIFALDLQRLGGISREAWLNRQLWAQLQAAMQGRRVFVSSGGGLAITVDRQPGKRPRKRLPALIPLDLQALPDGAYTVTLGETKHGPVVLDLAGKQRAILTGGTSGSGKTTLMQSVILQLAHKHTPEEFRVAIVDTKEVDFGRGYEALPHLFAPIAHSLGDAIRLIGQVENERQRRQAVMAAANVAHWRDLAGDDAFPLLLLVVDEAADFARSPAMITLIEVARKGRAFGVSLILGTQSPSSKVIDPQVRANLPTAIAFQARTDIESRVILGRKGAEDLTRPGLALAFLDGEWQTVQTLWAEPETVQAIVEEVSAPSSPALTDVEANLVQYAIAELGGAFTINKLFPSFKGRISKPKLTKLGQQWQARGWLTEPSHAADPRRVTDDLLALLPPARGPETVDTQTRGTGEDTGVQTGTRPGTGADTALDTVWPGGTRATGVSSLVDTGELPLSD